MREERGRKGKEENREKEWGGRGGERKNRKDE